MIQTGAIVDVILRDADTKTFVISPAPRNCGDLYQHDNFLGIWVIWVLDAVITSIEGMRGGEGGMSRRS